ncbi:NFACT family protein [Cyanobacterium stanieri LEGE 03274]|uniref:Rqc2 homolog RqcH n=1 Tax=Cyanobacterium stanieri LEGE 03274 TaxID=1828756 RepID=A0ABR9V897_9CHRO|nr:NFACT RNA binding domain-containing protein [Cyanobacterium stanieri]MBE9223356.1 NFACT family protein [Cyanobacterium stanieri LEGE 03274]
MQPVDYTTLVAICDSLNAEYIPSRLEQVYQCDRTSISLCLRSLKKKSWLTIAWHPQAARICIGNAPPRKKDTFTFSEQLRHLISGYALIGVNIVSEWERVVDFQFAQRPNETPLYHLYVEVMGKYSNVILTNAQQQIITVAKQITAAKSSVRTVETSQIYQLPPPLSGNTPKIDESFTDWQETVNLIPGRLDKQLIKSYGGVSPTIAKELINYADIKLPIDNYQLTIDEWKNLYQQWQKWLMTIQEKNFYPHTTSSGYSILSPVDENVPKEDLHQIINDYYTKKIDQEKFQQLQQQLKQKIKSITKKLQVKADKYQDKINQSKHSEIYRTQADLLMANLHQWSIGSDAITLNDFTTGEPIKIDLAPDKNAIQNAQALYKKHQKLKRAKDAVKPLLEEVNAEINYLQQTLNNVLQLDNSDTEDFDTLAEIKAELISQKYIEDNQHRQTNNNQESQPRAFKTPSNFEVLVGRNNRQNDLLISRIATDYDLWFHAQEIPGSHVLLRLNAGDIPGEKDLQYTANVAAYYSQGRESDQVPVIYTKPKYVYKPKGAKPGMVIYSNQTVIWGKSSEFMNS